MRRIIIYESEVNKMKILGQVMRWVITSLSSEHEFLPSFLIRLHPGEMMRLTDSQSVGEEMMVSWIIDTPSNRTR